MNIALDFLRTLVRNNVALQPSYYAFLLPKYKPSELDFLASMGKFPRLSDMSDSLVYCAVFGFLRIVLTYVVMKPLAIRCMRIKNVHTASKKITKFVEALWRFLFYSYFCYLGYMALFQPQTVSWIHHTKEHWQNWPLQQISIAISFYYNIELGSYLHQLMWTEVSRSDSLEMMLHHIVTILLILFSYLTNFTRIGASILLLHDAADIFLESAKLFVYTSKAWKTHKTTFFWTDLMATILFALFALTFLITRLVLYPRYLVYSLVVEAPAMLGK